MSTIRETVANTLANAGLSGYTGQAEPVIAALEAREQEISAALTSFAVGKGLPRSEAIRTFEGVGLSLTPEPVAAVAASPGGVDPSLFSRLVEFARSHGFRG